MRILKRVQVILQLIPQCLRCQKPEIHTATYPIILLLLTIKYSLTLFSSCIRTAVVENLIPNCIFPCISSQSSICNILIQLCMVGGELLTHVTKPFVNGICEVLFSSSCGHISMTGMALRQSSFLLEVLNRVSSTHNSNP